MPETYFRHYKGNEYRIVAIAKHTETLEDLIVYQDINDESKIWARPRAMFEDEIEVDGKNVRRFTPFEREEGKNYCMDPKSLANIFGKLNNLGK